MPADATVMLLSNLTYDANALSKARSDLLRPLKLVVQYGNLDRRIENY